MTDHPKRKLSLLIIIRSILFNCVFYSTVFIAVFLVLAPTSLLKSAKPMRRSILCAINFLIWQFEHIAGIKVVEKGIENIPSGKGFIYCSKHMSNMDALVLYRRSPNLTALAKKELFRVPLLNMVFKKMRVMAINRGAGEAQKQTPEIARVLVERKMPMIIFAEGTRTVVGERRPLKAGAYFYQQEEDELDIIVVAHNSGAHWPKRSFIKWPGTMTVEYFPTMPRGLGKDAFMAEVEKRLLDRSEQLMDL